MNLREFLKNQKYDKGLCDIIIDIQMGAIEIFSKLNEEYYDYKGSAGEKNIQNEEVQKLDIIANNIFIEKFKKNIFVEKLLSEENKEPIKLNKSGKYIVAMDPLDGSSNIDVNIPVGSIFSVLQKNPNDFLQKGDLQKLACYVIYGTNTVFVIAIDKQVHSFSLNSLKKEFYLTQKKIQTPVNGNIFSINEGNYKSFSPEILKYLEFCKSLDLKNKRTHTGRFIGSLVADFHRNLIKGGIFIYPKTNDRPSGQLRLIYECNPIAYIAKHAGGLSTNLRHDILKITPTKNHERVAFVVGSKNMVQKLLSFR